MKPNYTAKICFKFSTTERIFQSILTLLRDNRELNEMDSSVLSLEEELVFHSFPHSKRKKSYLLGRSAAKVALKEHFKTEDSGGNFSILNDIFNCPYVSNHPLGISISHTEDVGAAIVFPSTISIGVDIEETEALIKGELDGLFNKVIFITDLKNRALEKGLCWVAAEALGKALRMGLTLDLELLAPRIIEKVGSIFKCEYAHFSMFSSVLLISSNLVLGICYCNKAKIEIEFNFLKNLLEDLQKSQKN